MFHLGSFWQQIRLNETSISCNNTIAFFLSPIRSISCLVIGIASKIPHNILFLFIALPWKWKNRDAVWEGEGRAERARHSHSRNGRFRWEAVWCWVGGGPGEARPWGVARPNARQCVRGTERKNNVRQLIEKRGNDLDGIRVLKNLHRKTSLP